MDVLIPSPLLSYTRRNHVEAQGGTLGEVLEDLDRQFPGLRFRIVDEQNRPRAHMRFFVNQKQTFDLSARLDPRDRIQIVQALSGG